MIKRILNLTAGGLLVIGLGVIVAGLTIWFSSSNDRFLEEGLTREGRIISRHHSDSEPKHTLRVRADISTDANEVLTRIVEVEVPAETFTQSPVGSQIALLILPGDPPAIRLKTKTEDASFGTGYLLAFAMVVLGLVLIWLDRRETKPRPVRTPELPETLRKIATKTTTLYEGAFEFSYAEEKTRIELADGSSLRISQYRPLSELPSALPEDDLLEVLRSAKSEWKIPRNLPPKQALATLVKRREITGADQFFINGDHLGLLFRDEVDTGHWSAWVRGVWQLSPRGRLLAALLSRDPARACPAAEQVLYHEDTSYLAPLTGHAKPIRRAAVGSHDEQDLINLAADLLEALGEGTCPCQVYTESAHFAPDLLIARKKMRKADESANDTAHNLACTSCSRKYTVTAKVRAGVPLFDWQEQSSDSHVSSANQ